MKKFISVFLCIVLLFSLAACGGRDQDDVELDENGNVIGGKVAKLEFWGWGDPEEVAVFRKLTEEFNAANKQIEVTYIQKAPNGYSQATATALSGRNAPDVVYVGDGDIKQWASLDLLEPLDLYLEKSTALDPQDMWDSSIQRYRYDKTTQQSRPQDPLYAVPKDIGPTVIYYNETNFRNAGIEIISVYEQDIAQFNTANQKNYPAKGYFINQGNKVFNNKIPMTWDETVELSKLFTKSYNPSSPSEYGYFTEWWFSYAWSVGGDCIKFNEQSGNWEFSLGDETVRKNEQGQEMPTTLEAFTHFVRLSQPTNKDVDGKGNYGLAIAPSPDTLNTVGKSNYFTSGKTTMMVDGRWATVINRKNIKAADKGGFVWDVAPLPKAATGVEAGHSGSVGMAISKKSKVKNAAWKFCEFIAGKEGQTAQAETGFNIPNQKSIAKTEVFLQSNQMPKNSEIFLRAAEVQNAGDWTYLPDNLWIQKWAPTLNDEVRNGKINLTQFFSKVTADTNQALKEYTKK